MSLMQQSMLHAKHASEPCSATSHTHSNACHGCLLVWAARNLGTGAARIVEQGHGRGGESMQLGTDASALPSAKKARQLASKRG
jgi:hypothetical protein